MTRSSMTRSSMTRRSSLGPQRRQDFLGGNRDPPAVLELHQHLAGQDLLRQHPPLPFRRQYAAADAGQLTLMLLIDVLLEPQTAFEPAAAARDLRRVERRSLQLGHP